MEKVRYMISDASSMVNVESHVLRYWEDELELNIPRNEMGHRYYTQENIKEFQYIKELKEKGYQLKAIKMIVHNGDMEQRLPELTGNEADKPGGVKNHQVYFKNPETLALAEAKQSILDNTDRMAQFTELMTDIVGKAIAANNENLSRTISEDVGEQVLKEMNYLMREREELEEERFRQLDEAIRGNLKKKKTPLLKKWTKKKTLTVVGVIFAVVVISIASVFLEDIIKDGGSKDNSEKIYNRFCSTFENAGYTIAGNTADADINIPYGHTYCKKMNRYITYDGKYVYVLLFDSEDEARSIAEFENNFGVYVCLNGKVLAISTSYSAIRLLG